VESNKGGFDLQHSTFNVPTFDFPTFDFPTFDRTTDY